MLTANEWIRQQASWNTEIARRTKRVANLHTNAFLEQSSIYQLILALDLYDRAEEVRSGFHIMEASGLVNARARTARVRILNHAFRQLCEVWA